MNRDTPNNLSTTRPVCDVRWCEASFRADIYPWAIAIIIFNVLSALTAILGNGLLFLVYYKTRSIRKPANTILLSLAVADFLTGAVSQPLFICEKLLMLFNCTSPVLCVIQRLKNFFMVGLFEATVVNLSLASLDRYIAVFYSFRYVGLVTNSRVVKTLLATWAFVIGLTTVNVFSWTGSVYIPLIIIIPPNVLLICILYSRIFKEIRRLEANPVVSANEAEEQRKARERKSAKTVAMVLGVLFLCFVPMLLFLAFSLVQRFVFNNAVPLVVRQQNLYIAVTFAALNSSLNVFIYYWKNTEIRSAILKVFGPVTQRLVHTVNPA